MADQKAVDAFHAIKIRRFNSFNANIANLPASQANDQTSPIFRDLIKHWYYFEENTQAKIASIFKAGIAKDRMSKLIWEGLLESYELNEVEKKTHTPEFDVNKVGLLELFYLERTIVNLFEGLWSQSPLTYRSDIVRFFIGVVQCSEHCRNLFSDIIPTMDAKHYQTALKVVASLHDLPQSTRDTVVLSLKKKLIGEPASGPDLSAWKPSEQYAARSARSDLGRKENVVEFLQRVWSPFVASGVPLAKLRDEDRQGYNALYNFKREHGLPPSLPLISSLDESRARIDREASMPTDLRSARTEWALESRRRYQHAKP